MQNHRPSNFLILSMQYSDEIGGGVGISAQELSAGLSRSGDHVVVLSCTLGKPAKLVEGNRTVYLLPPSPPANGSSSVTQGILAFNKDLVAYARKTVFAECAIPDLIQCSNWLTFPAARELGRSFGVPVVCRIHFVSEPCERWWGQIPDPEIVEQEAIAFREADRLVTVSNSIRTIVQRAHGIPDSKINVVYNGINIEAFSESNVLPQQLSKLKTALAPGGEKIALFAGRLNPQKGVLAILASIPRVLEQYPNVRYVFAGEPDSQDFARKVRETLDENSSLKAKTLFLGKVPRRKLAALYKVADVALVPSVYEPFGYASIEAMAAGVPVVVSSAGGLAEIVDHEKTGLCVSVHAEENRIHRVDVADLALATMRMLSDEEFARNLALAAGQKVRKMFDSEALVRGIRATYQLAISEFQPRCA
jgi:glycosyltransferase involved in cell wall biosynthesis